MSSLWLVGQKVMAAWHIYHCHVLFLFPVLFMSQTGRMWAFVGRPGRDEGGTSPSLVPIITCHDDTRSCFGVTQDD